MKLKPGQPRVTDQDKVAWAYWRKERKRQQQRDRRKRNRRIDYYPSDKAAQVILSQVGLAAGGDYSSVINRIVLQWAGQVTPE